MGRQILFCVETDETARTDVIYIKETIKKFYKPISNTDNIDFICMGSKQKYNSKSIVRKIKDKVKMFNPLGDTTVIYCIDTDKYETNATQNKELEDITKYCNENEYLLVWFCHDIEEVYWGFSIENSGKKRKAVEFQTKGLIKNVDIKRLIQKSKTRSKSNLMSILDVYFDRL